MRFSLSAKLALLLLAALACVLAPALAIMHASVSENTLRADKERFLTSILLAQEDIDTGFLHLNARKAEGVLRAKKRLRAAAISFAPLLSPAGEDCRSAPAPVWLREELRAANARDGITLDFFQPDVLFPGWRTEIGLHAGLRDFKGESLGESLAKLPATGRYGIYRLPGIGPTLVYLFPAHGSVVACSISVRALEAEAETASGTLLRSLEERFASLAMHRDGFIGLFDNTGAALIRKGVFGDAERAALEPLFAAARDADGVRETILRIQQQDGGAEKDYLAVTSFSRPFQWILVMAAPMDEINARSRVLLVRLVAQSLGIGLAVLLISLLLLRRVTSPLRVLLRKIKTLPETDFSSRDADITLAEDLPLVRRDEVGDLARSFSAMGARLHGNIRALVASNAARERMQGELNAAREIQQGILPPPDLAPNVFGMSSSAMLEPAREVGGDLYYFFTLPDGRYAFVIGDVSGKGVPAALFMSVAVTMARYALAGEDDPGAAMTKINAMLEAHNPQSMFVTLFLALYDPASGRMEYANGGHNPPWLVLGRDIVPLEGVSGPVVGFMPGLEYRNFSCVLRPGELCLLYTDGVTEAADEAGNFYGEERLRRCLLACGAAPPRDLLVAIFEDVKRFRGEAPPSDDITMLAFARH
jgi:sigma-B regulation protein RsbU (phosphoserine phosphatase)